MASISRIWFTPARVDAFADLSGDRNPLHMDDGAARRLFARSRVVHGLLVVLDGLKLASRQVPAAKFTVQSPRPEDEILAKQKHGVGCRSESG